MRRQVCLAVEVGTVQAYRAKHKRPRKSKSIKRGQARATHCDWPCGVYGPRLERLKPLVIPAPVTLSSGSGQSLSEPIFVTAVQGSDPVQAAPAFWLVMPIPAKVKRSYLSRAGACLILTASVPGLTTSGNAHDWYPEECCHAKDCAPVESWAFTQKAQTGSLPQLSVTIVPKDIPRRESKDNRMHACMRAGWAGEKRIVCIFLPPGT